MKNLENNAEFNVRWGWADHDLTHGFTAVLRLKNEARTLPHTLPPLLRAVRNIVIVDNGSTDGTPAVARRVARECGAADRLEVQHYPFSISRCGAEHLGTPADSVHSLAYYYNWSFQHVRTTYALKWDGDMVLSDDMVEVFRDLEWQLEAGPSVLIRVPRYPLYLSGDDKVAFLDTGLRNNEPWGWPNLPGYQFVKAMEWEMPVWDFNLQTLELPDWGCIELKFLDDDEFGHWTDTEFERSSRQKRKQREFEVFQALNRGAEPPADVVRIEAPEGESVVEHIRTVWLPGPRSRRTEPGLMDVVVAGGHGQIALLLHPLLVAEGDRVRALIRNPDHADDGSCRRAPSRWSATSRTAPPTSRRRCAARTPSCSRPAPGRAADRLASARSISAVSCGRWPPARRRACGATSSSPPSTPTRPRRTTAVSALTCGRRARRTRTLSRAGSR